MRLLDEILDEVFLSTDFWSLVMRFYMYYDISLKVYFPLPYFSYNLLIQYYSLNNDNDTSKELAEFRMYVAKMEVH